MSPEKQRIAVAETQGWRTMKNYRDWLCIRPDEVTVGYVLLSSCPTIETAWKVWFEFDTIPNYLSDLNAMWEVEETLGKRAYEYYLNLADVGLGGNNHWKRYHATAAQRAEAFLRTVGKWEDAPVAAAPIVSWKKKCKCGREGSEELHVCLFQADVNNDSKFMCNCCEKCEQNCRDDI